MQILYFEKGITGEYGCFLTSVGCWWGVGNITDKSGNVRAQSTDIDVVGISDIDKKRLLVSANLRMRRSIKVFMKL